MRTARSAALLWSAAAMFAVAAHAQPPVKEQNGMLVDPSGMTVYTYDKDNRGSGKSVCNDACAKNWPPVVASDTAKPEGDYSVVQRDDGSKQWAYKGMPLYTFIKDKQAGDTTGDNVRDVWHVVKP
jgi:Uncharacterized protein conserved in bacteria